MLAGAGVDAAGTAAGAAPVGAALDGAAPVGAALAGGADGAAAITADGGAPDTDTDMAGDSHSLALASPPRTGAMAAIIRPITVAAAAIGKTEKALSAGTVGGRQHRS